MEYFIHSNVRFIWVVFSGVFVDNGATDKEFVDGR